MSILSKLAYGPGSSAVSLCLQPPQILFRKLPGRLEIAARGVAQEAVEGGHGLGIGFVEAIAQSQRRDQQFPAVRLAFDSIGDAGETLRFAEEPGRGANAADDRRE